MNKQAESDFTAFCKEHRIWAHKWRDVSYCPNCRKPIFVTTRTDRNDTRAVRESIVDYLIFIGEKATWVECKGKGGQSRFDFKDLAPHQRQFLVSWQDRGLVTWLFLTFGPGRVPHDRRAWLMPINAFLGFEKFYTEETGRKSVSFDDAVFFLEELELKWGKYRNNSGGWLMPVTHLFVQSYPEVTLLPPLYEEQ